MPEFWYGENDIEKYEVTFSTDAFYLDATARDAVMIHVETDFSTWPRLCKNSPPFRLHFSSNFGKSSVMIAPFAFCNSCSEIISIHWAMTSFFHLHYDYLITLFHVIDNHSEKSKLEAISQELRQ